MAPRRGRRARPRPPRCLSPPPTPPRRRGPHSKLFAAYNGDSRLDVGERVRTPKLPFFRPILALQYIATCLALFRGTSFSARCTCAWNRYAPKGAGILRNQLLDSRSAERLSLKTVLENVTLPQRFKAALAILKLFRKYFTNNSHLRTNVLNAKV